MALLALLVILCGSMFAAGSDGKFYNCSNITTQQPCVDSGWCLWLGGACHYDNCLISLGPNGAASDCPGGAPNGAGSSCNLYYLTDAHDCSDGSELQIDRYCREAGASFVHNVIDSCFYKDLVAKTASDTGLACGDKWCQQSNTSGIGFYCSVNPDEKDCTSLFSNPAEFCDCLGTKWCLLYPKCWLNGTGNNQACILDPCAKGEASSTAPCTKVPGVPNCNGRLEQYYDKTTGDISTRYVCATTTNNKPNQCYFAQTTTSSSNYPQYPECTVYTSDKAVCESGFVYDNSTNQPLADPKQCELVELPGGYFPGNSYCNDGREVPSVTGAGAIVGVPFLVLLVAGLASLFL